MKRKRHKSIYFLASVVMLIGGVVFFQIADVYQKTVAKEQELEKANQELFYQNERRIELEERIDYVQTDEFIIEVGNEEFNMILDNQILFIPEK